MDRFKRISDLIEKPRKKRNRLNLRHIGNNVIAHDSFVALRLDENGEILTYEEEKEP